MRTDFGSSGVLKAQRTPIVTVLLSASEILKRSSTSSACFDPSPLQYAHECKETSQIGTPLDQPPNNHN